MKHENKTNKNQLLQNNIQQIIKKKTNKTKATTDSEID